MKLLGRSDIEVLAMTAYAEADCLGVVGMTATLNTVMNRLATGIRWWGTDPRTICLKPWQYSCWNADNRRLPQILSVTMADSNYAAALRLAQQALVGGLQDVTAGATHYYNHKIVTDPPRWGKGTPTYILEPHWYYRVTL